MKLTEETQECLVKEIRNIHKHYYAGDFLKDAAALLSFHRSLEYLFNIAEIEDTLVDNNRDEQKGISPERFKEEYGL